MTARLRPAARGTELKTTIFVLTLITLPVFGATRYVRSGATGTGTDWNNACGDFAGSCAVSTMARGDVYYVADGSYPARDWNKATSGTSLITIKKATASDHGTDTGWSAGYGDGQAVFVGTNTISTGYWDF